MAGGKGLRHGGAACAGPRGARADPTAEESGAAGAAAASEAGFLPAGPCVAGTAEEGVGVGGGGGAAVRLGPLKREECRERGEESPGEPLRGEEGAR